MARAMILAAGFGTRLRPLTLEIPKPLLPFGDRSLLEHAYDALRRAGIVGPIVVNVHHLADEFERAVGELGLEVQLVRESRIRGTAGGIAGARDALRAEVVLVATADVVLERVPAGFGDSARSGGMVMAIAPRPAGTGPVGIGRDGNVVRLRGRSFGEEVEGGEYVGLMALGARALAELPADGCYIEHYALPLLARGGAIEAFRYVHGFALPGDDLSTYWRENLRWLDERRGGDSYVHSSASIEDGVDLQRTIVGRGSTVGGVGELRNVVLLPGARADAPFHDAVVAPRAGVLSCSASPR